MTLQGVNGLLERSAAKPWCKCLTQTTFMKESEGFECIPPGLDGVQKLAKTVSYVE